MSRDAMPLLLLPPPGPITWLHPELSKLEDWAETPSLRTWDLGRRGPFGVALVHAILDSGVRRVLIPDGPRAAALRAGLVQALRGRGIRVDLRPPDRVVLEHLLADLASDVTIDRCVHVTLVGERLRATPVPLLQAPNGQSAAWQCWLLPLRPGPTLEDQLLLALRVIGRTPSDYRALRLVPYFMTDLSHPGGVCPSPRAGAGDEGSRGRETAARVAHEPVETRLEPSWWGLLPGDRYPARVRERLHELMRLLWPERMMQFLALESCALAGFDLYYETLFPRAVPFPGHECASRAAPVPTAMRPDRAATRRTRRAGTPRAAAEIGCGAAGAAGAASARQPLIVVFCGIDGAGKSSHLAAARTYLEAKGLVIQTHKIFRHGLFHDTVTDLNRQCAGEKNLHLWRVQRLVKVFDSVKYFHAFVEPGLEQCDVMLFDRYTFTHHAEAAGRYHHDPWAWELLNVFPRPHRVYLLDLPAEQALARIGARAARTVDENPYMLARYREALLDLGDRHGFVVRDAQQPFAANQAVIRADLDVLVAAIPSGRQ